jgi:peroxiredoxin family protein
MEEKPQKCVLIVMSGDFDHAFAAFTIASTAAAMGMETTMFFTFWGIKAVQTGNFTGKGLFGRMVGVMNRGGIDRIGPSKFNFGGIGRWMFKKMMRDKNVTSLPELRQQCIDLGVKFLACLTSMDVMEITLEDLIPEARNPAGAATMLAEAQQAQIQLFI